MDKRIIRSLQSFTILEVTIVAAVLSILVTIITITLNRFNEQLKVNRGIREELNNWMLVRSNFWNEYYLSDSAGMDNRMLVFYQPHRSIYYKLEEDKLMRKEVKKMNVPGTPLPEDWTDMNVDAASIKEDTSNDRQLIILTFLLKGDNMELSFLKQKSKTDLVNRYYEKLNE